jgi:hypothetical protein
MSSEAFKNMIGFIGPTGVIFHVHHQKDYRNLQAKQAENNQN